MATTHASVADYLAALSPSQRGSVEELIEMVRGVHRDLVESIKWNSPNWSLDGTDLLTVNAGPKGPVRLILHRGAITPERKGVASSFAGDPDGLLTWHSDIRASLVAGPSAGAVIRAWVSWV